MTDCNILFGRKEQLQRDEQQLWEATNTLELNARAARWTSGDIDPERLKEVAGKAFDRLNLAEVQEAIGRAMEEIAPVSIGEGQPTNFRMLWARFGEDASQVEDYAQLHQLVTGGHNIIDPQDYLFLTQEYGRDRIIDLIHGAYGDAGLSRGVLERMVSDTAPFATLVEKATRVRALADGFQAGYIQLVRRAAQEMETGGAVSAATQGQLLSTYGYALATGRNWDLIRRRTGQTLRMMGEQINELRPLTADQVQEALARSFDLPETPAGAAAPPTAPGASPAAPGRPRLAPSPEDLGPDSPIAPVLEAIADGQTRPDRAARSLRNIAAMASVDGLDPRARFGDDVDGYINHMLRYGNSLAKDSMLTQLRSHLALNVPSNALMALYGPVHEAMSNVWMIRAFGSEINRDSLLATQKAAWNAYGDAMRLTIGRGRQLFMDSFWEGRNIYSSNRDLQSSIDINTRHVQPNEIEAAYQDAIQRMTIPMEGPGDIFRNTALTWGKVQAAWRTKLMDWGVPLPMTRLGHRLSSSVDNVGGYFFHTFKLRNDLYLKARLQAGELGLKGEREIMDWVEAQARKEYQHYRPSEAEVLARRQQEGLGAEVSNAEIASMIADERTAAASVPNSPGADFSAPGYWAPRTDTELSGRAWDFSEKMRFAVERENALARGIQGFRRHWAMDAAVPFYQIPLNGSLFDVNLIRDAAPPIFGLKNWNTIEPRKRASMMANWMMAGHAMGLFVALDALDGGSENLIVGNGPVNPQEREEWMTELRSRGLKPNSIGGVPVGGIPFLNTLMLWRDLKENRVGGRYNRGEDADLLIGLGQVLTAQMYRMPGVAQVRQILELLSAQSPNYGSRTSEFAGFMGASYFNPLSGPTREAGRLMGMDRRDVLREAEPTQAEQDAGIDWGMVKRTEEWLKGLAYAAVPPTMAFNPRREIDHLGNPVRLPWGMQAHEAENYRFFPGVWPEAEKKLYAELDRLNLLRPPTPVLLKTLQGARMGPELQKEYIDTLVGIRGDKQALADMAITRKLPFVDFKAMLPVELQRGIRLEEGVKITRYPLGQMVAQYVDGRTRLEAFRAAVKSPVHQYLMSLPEGTPGPTKRQAEAIAGTILKSVDSYYQQQTLMRINTSTSPAAMEWKKRRDLLEAQRSVQAGVEAAGTLIPGISNPPPAE